MEEKAFDVLVLGTSLTNSIVAAALARAGKRVVHLDRSDCYGERGATHDGRGFVSAVGATMAGAAMLEGELRKLALDQCPKPLYSSGPLVALLVRSGVAKYLEFKCLQGARIHTPSGGWLRVPASKADVFQSAALSLPDKRRLMQFLQLLQAPLDEEWRTRAFREYLDAHHVSGSLRELVWFGIAGGPAVDVPTDEAMRSLQLYLSSVGRFGKSAFLFPLYGCSEVAQAFCRLAAVHGCVYMLRAPVERIEVLGERGFGTANFEAAAVVASLSYATDAAAVGASVVECFHAVCLVRSASPPFGDDVTEEALLHLRWVVGDDVVHGIQLDSSMHVCPAGTFLLQLWCRSSAALEAALPRDCEWTARFTAHARVVNAATAPPDGIHWTSDDSSLVEDFSTAVGEAERIFRAIAGPDCEFLPAPLPADAEQ